MLGSDVWATVVDASVWVTVLGSDVWATVVDVSV